MNLTWDAVPDTGIQGYRVYVGTQSGQYSMAYLTGAIPIMPVGQLEFGRTYYFTVSTIDGSGVESARATELAVTIAPPPLPMASSVGRIGNNGSGQYALKWAFPAAALGSSPEFIIQASPDLKTWTDHDTVSASEVVSSSGGTANFTWPIQSGGVQMFYRLSARNFMGIAISP